MQDLSLAWPFRAEHTTYLLRYTFKVLRQLAVPKSEYRETQHSKLAGSHIVVALLDVRMLFSVELDDQTRCHAAKIDYE
jgi:hypothetical protein